jgi:hypothetical protein
MDAETLERIAEMLASMDAHPGIVADRAYCRIYDLNGMPVNFEVKYDENLDHHILDGINKGE